MMRDTAFDIPIHYDRHFEVIRAATPRLVREAYRLRYQVYCVENPFEDADQHDTACECDADDDRSVHTLLLHRRTGEVAGTSRVILPGPRFRPLPMATLLKGSDRRLFESFPLAHTAEMSRFAVSKQFRQRRGDERFGDLRPSDALVIENERRLMPFMSLGLIRGLFGICIEHEITHLAAVMEPSLIRILHRLGLRFVPIGGTVMHRGLRQPCFAELDELIRHSRETDSIVWQYAMEPMLRQHNHKRAYAAA